MATYDVLTPGTGGSSGPPPNQDDQQDILNRLLRTARDAAVGYGSRLAGNVAGEALGLGAGQRGPFNPAAAVYPLVERGVQAARLAGLLGDFGRSLWDAMPQGGGASVIAPSVIRHAQRDDPNLVNRGRRVLEEAGQALTPRPAMVRTLNRIIPPPRRPSRGTTGSW